MYISQISIKNYRTFKDFQCKLSDFSIIIGENNIGKTTLLEALEYIINPSKFYRYFPLEQQDFIDYSRPIEIKITFDDPDDMLISKIEDGIIDPEENKFTLKFESKWDLENQDVVNDCYFIKKGDPDSNSHFKKIHRELIHFYLIPCERPVKNSISSSKSSDLSKILKTHLKSYIIPLDVVQGQLKEKFSEFQKIIKEEFQISDLTSTLEEIRTQLGLKFQNDSINKIRNNLEECKRKIGQDKYKLQKNQVKIVSEKIDLIQDLLNTAEKKITIKEGLKVLKTILSNTDSFDNLEEEISNIIQDIMPIKKFDFSFVSIKDEELFKEPLFKIDDFHILKHGMGFQSYFVICLKLLNIITLLRRNNEKSAFISIEEPGANVYPHLQRQLIKNLRKFIKKFQKKYDIKIQFIITSHSSEILSQFKSHELVILKRKGVYSEAIYPPSTDQYTQISSSTEEKKKLSRKHFMIERNLINFFPETFFSRAIILGEGPSEKGAIPAWSEIMEKDLDKYGITCVHMHGEGNKDYYKKYFDMTKIPYFVILDKDKYRQPTYNELITNEKAFEAEILKNYPLYKILLVLERMFGPSSLKNFYIDLKKHLNLPAHVKNFNECIEYAKKNAKKLSLNSKLETLLVKWMKKKKGAMFGYFIGREAKENEIPQVYKNLIEKTIKLI